MAASTFAWLSVVKRAENVICFICQSDGKSPFCKQPSNVAQRRKLNFIFVVCLELVLWFLFLLWNLYCGFIDQNDNEIQIFFFFFSPATRVSFCGGSVRETYIQLGMA